jgi:hypothetical protein
MKKNRSQLGFGVLLILLGAWFVAERTIPAVSKFTSDLVLQFGWPIYLFAAGALILLIALLFGAPGMAIPAALVSGIGGILYYQNSTGDWASWSYMWTLIPGFVGVGQIVEGILRWDFVRGLRRGLNGLFVSGVLFLIFSTLLGGMDLLGDYGVGILLLLLGAFIVGRGLFRMRKE